MSQTHQLPDSCEPARSVEPGLAGLLSRRGALRAGLLGGAALATAALPAEPARAAPAMVPVPAPTAVPAPSWKRYPYTVFGNPVLALPQVEGLTDYETDSWYVDGKLVGQVTGKQYAFVTIFCKNRLVGGLRADFTTFALFDLDTGDYGTSTTIDFPPDSLLGTPKLFFGKGFLDLAADTVAGRSTWTTRKTATGALVPFGYRLGLVGKDQFGRPMGLSADLDPRNRPTAVGGPAAKGTVTMFGQAGTATYFQTATAIRGSLSWGGHSEPVVGTLGHIDRQLFPKYAGVNAGLLARDRSHEWRSVNLDDGTDLSLWRQFDRTQRNAVVPFTGSTRYLPALDRTDFSPQIEVVNTSYVKWPASISVFVPLTTPNRYVASAHVLRVPDWGLTLTARPLVAAPAHGLPVEYMIGPMDYRGTLAGRPISGFGVSERTLVLYRDWELVGVAQVTVDNLPAAAFVPGGTTRAGLRAVVDTVGRQIDGGNKLAAILTIETAAKPAVETLAAAHRPFLRTLLADVESAPFL